MLDLRDVSLDDKYRLSSGQAFVTGIQALVRLPMLQADRDRAAGRHTAGYVTGYRGSPLGALDQQFAFALGELTERGIRFQPAVNEDLAATAVWGTQQAGLNGDGRYDGVFSMWYAKGPGVDRSGDPLRHGNLAGSSALGGVLVLMGDDHTCESSTTAHQSEYSLINTFIPILNPAGVQDILDFGLYGWALSRFSGCWVGLKSVHDTVEASASIAIDRDRVQTRDPADFALPQGGLNLRWPDTPQEQEARLHQFKLPAVAAFVRANPIDRQVMGNSAAPIGIISTGKSYLDVRRALLELKIDDGRARALGVKLYKVGMPWPLEASGLKAFALGTRKLIVVEEKRGLIEDQVKQILYGEANPPVIIGKRDELGSVLFPVEGRLDATQMALAIGDRLLAESTDKPLEEALLAIRARLEKTQLKKTPMRRIPYFCAGCPHNTSTVVPEGSRALAGIGCHYMAQWMDRETATFTQMGGEGASWIGESPFSHTSHVFQNIGDGTYFHSGLLAIRACVSAGVNITYKILFNDAVAMTGGQSFDGPLDVMRISRQVHAEGVDVIAVVTDDPLKYPPKADWAPGVKVYDRTLLARVQRELREIKGTSVIIFDQTCAAEKRRRRRRGLMETPNERLFINTAVCEGCGDCGTQSNCVALTPVETDLGRKRAIDQSACNLDYSCKKGFCPSFVTVVGGTRRTETRTRAPMASLEIPTPEPQMPSIDRQYSIVLNGVGGTGIVTIGAIIGMAAHVARLGCSVLDMAGLAQKGGEVTSHIILAPSPDDISATHVADGGAHLLLGCDLVTSAAEGTRKKLSDETLSIVNTHQMMSGDFIHNPQQRFPSQELLEVIRQSSKALREVPATHLAQGVFGDTMTSNMIMLGYAFQAGAVPIPALAIEQAISLNGRAVRLNTAAFRLGRQLFVDEKAVLSILNEEGDSESFCIDDSPMALLGRRSELLSLSHGKGRADQLGQWVNQFMGSGAGSKQPRYAELLTSIIHSAFHVLYDKDEYEVARLYGTPEFKRQLEREFEGNYRLKVHLAPPIISQLDPATGRPKKREFGAWIFSLFSVLGMLRRIRGRWFDPFRHSSERVLARDMQSRFATTVADLCATPIDNENFDTALALARWPQAVKGYGPVRMAAAAKAVENCAKLTQQLSVMRQSRQVA